jgi:hypothetical protein
MQSSLKYVLALMSFAVMATFAGCGGGNPFDTVPVTGTVTLDGQPVDGALVLFQPSGDHKAASGTTDSSGKFTLTTGNAGDGAMPGQYKVTVSKTKTEASADLSGMSFEEAAVKAKQEDDERMKKYPGGQPPVQELLPVNYKDIEKSGLTFEVKRDQENNFAIELKKGG